MKFSANLSFLYPELGFLERFAAAARDGFAAVEYLGPYAEPKQTVAETLAANGLVQALFNVPSGDWAGGERGIAALPGRSDEFRAMDVSVVTYPANPATVVQVAHRGGAAESETPEGVRSLELAKRQAQADKSRRR